MRQSALETLSSARCRTQVPQRPCHATPNVASAPKPAPRRSVGQAPAAKKAAAKPAVVKAQASPPQAAKPQRLRLVRDGFTMPEADFGLIATLKARAVDGKRPAKKSELLRAGLHALMDMSIAQLGHALAALEPVKTGRPKKGG